MWHLSNQGSGGGMSIDDLEEGLVWRCFLVGRGDGGKSACCWGSCKCWGIPGVSIQFAAKDNRTASKSIML